MTTFTKTPPTEPGWYYWKIFLDRSDYDVLDVFKEDGRLFVADADDDLSVRELGGFWGDRVPAPGMTFTVEETAAYLEEHLDAKLNIRNQNLEEAIRFINDELCGLAATTNRNRKEQG